MTQRQLDCIIGGGIGGEFGKHAMAAALAAKANTAVSTETQ